MRRANNTYPIKREALRQLHLQVASARFDAWPELEHAARRAIKAVRNGRDAVAALDPEAAEALERAERGEISVQTDPAEDASLGGEA
jgi:phosphate uptake regulator